MMRAVLFVVALLGAASCSRIRGEEALASAPACGETAFSGALTPVVCQIDVSGDLVRFSFATPDPEATTGAVRAEVMGGGASVVQVLQEESVSAYLAPTAQDIDGDGRADIVIPLEAGNANIAQALWLFSLQQGAYRRVGVVSGVDIARTAEGYVVVPARSSAAVWSVAFYSLDETGLAPLITLNIEARGGDADGQAARATCTVEEAPGIPLLGLSAEDARARFCIEPAAQVFAP